MSLVVIECTSGIDSAPRGDASIVNEKAGPRPAFSCQLTLLVCPRIPNAAGALDVNAAVDGSRHHEAELVFAQDSRHDDYFDLRAAQRWLRNA